MKKSRKLILAITLLCAVSALVYITRYYLLFKDRENRYDQLILTAALKHNVPPSLIKAVIYQESTFQEDIRGKHGEYGLMQIRTLAADDWVREERKTTFKNYEQLLTPALNIEIGTWYLAKGLTKYHDYKHKNALALAHYNAGPGNVRKKKWVPSHKNGEVLKLITFPSTKEYIKSILKYEKEYKKQGLSHE